MYIPQGSWENSQSTTWNFLARFQNPIKLCFCHRHKATHVRVAVWGSFLMDWLIDLYGCSKALSSWSCFFKRRFETRKTNLLEYNRLEVGLVNNVRDLCSLLHCYRCTYPIVISFHCISLWVYSIEFSCSGDFASLNRWRWGFGNSFYNSARKD